MLLPRLHRALILTRALGNDPARPAHIFVIILTCQEVLLRVHLYLDTPPALQGHDVRAHVDAESCAAGCDPHTRERGKGERWTACMAEGREHMKQFEPRSAFIHTDEALVVAVASAERWTWQALIARRGKRLTLSDVRCNADAQITHASAER